MGGSSLRVPVPHLLARGVPSNRLSDRQTLINASDRNHTTCSFAGLFVVGLTTSEWVKLDSDPAIGRARELNPTPADPSPNSRSTPRLTRERSPDRSLRLHSRDSGEGQTATP